MPYIPKTEQAEFHEAHCVREHRFGPCMDSANIMWWPTATPAHPRKECLK